MKLILPICFLLLSLQSISMAQDPRIQYAEPGFESLFNGNDLDTSAWDYSPLWKVKDGEITATGTVSAIEFLTYKKKKYQDFILKARLILTNNKGNSGIQFRSKYLPGRPYNIGGYQADVGLYWWCRLIYWMENASPNVIVLSEPTNECTNSLKQNNQWNEYTVTAIGPKIKLEMNGFVCSEFTETDPGRLKDSGYIALQFHNPDYTQLRYRDIRIKSLDENATTGTMRTDAKPGAREGVHPQLQLKNKVGQAADFHVETSKGNFSMQGRFRGKE